ncbi:MAG: guanylate cyclase [Rhodobacteraceae bacterium]|nr:guanylate cyclase [Paracoccaceae bacterium]
MNVRAEISDRHYGITVEPLEGRVQAWRNGKLLASSTRAKVMYETRLPAAIYFPREDLAVCDCAPTDAQTFCPFKGTAEYLDAVVGGETLKNAVWSYALALPEAAEVEGFVAFMPGTVTDFDLGTNVLHPPSGGNLTGPLVDWLLRDAARIDTAEDLLGELAARLQDSGMALSRLAVMIWSLHPMIAGRRHLWTRDSGAVNVMTATNDILTQPEYLSSPLRHVSNGLGGVRQKIGMEYGAASFPIIEDLRAMGATDYVAMPLRFSDGRINVLTLTSDHPDGFSTSDLGLIFELSPVLSRYLEVFTLRDTAQSLLETYVGKRTGARVLGGEIRRGDGDEIDAAIMFCDLRGSTALEERLGRTAYIELLNRFFDTVSERIVEEGGEVLKFIGDAVLAVFPAGDDPDRARTQALAAARAIVAELDAPGLDPSGPRTEGVIGLAFGRVTYGNVGSQERLDFTVIGQPANIAARLGDHGKAIGEHIVMTEDIASGAVNARPLGPLRLYNISQPVVSYAMSSRDTQSLTPELILPPQASEGVSMDHMPG